MAVRPHPWLELRCASNRGLCIIRRVGSKAAVMDPRDSITCDLFPALPNINVQFHTARSRSSRWPCIALSLYDSESPEWVFRPSLLEPEQFSEARTLVLFSGMQPCALHPLPRRYHIKSFAGQARQIIAGFLFEGGWPAVMTTVPVGRVPQAAKSGAVPSMRRAFPLLLWSSSCPSTVPLS